LFFSKFSLFNSTGSCHCNDKLYSLIDSGGPLDALLGFVDVAKKEDVTTCNVYFTDYAQSTSLTYLGILVTIFLNHFITKVVKYFVSDLLLFLYSNLTLTILSCYYNLSIGT
jgi:hypothetical protein